MDAGQVASLVVGGSGIAAVIGAVIALFRLPGDRAGASVSTMAQVNDELEQAWRRAGRRAERWRRRCELREAELKKAGFAPGPLPVDLWNPDVDPDTNTTDVG